MSGKRRGVVKKVVYDVRLKYKLIILFSSIILIPLLLLGLYYKVSMENSMLASEKKTLEQDAAQLDSSLDMFLDTYLGVTNLLFTNTNLQSAIVAKPEDLLGVIRTRQEIAKILSMVHSVIRFPEIRNSDYTQGETILRLYINNDVLGGYGGDILTFDQVAQEPWCRELFETRGTVNWQAGIKLNAIDYTALSRRLVNYETGEDIGVLRLYIPVERLRRIIEKSVTKSDDMVLYVSQDGLPIVSVRGSGINIAAVREALEEAGGSDGIAVYMQRYLLKSMESETSGWRLYYFASMREITQRVRSVSVAMMLMILLALLLCVFGSALLATLITKRLDILVAKTNQIGAGALVADLHLDGRDEIGLIDKNFNGMLERINRLIEKEYKLNLQVNQARLELLQEQINPHLLYNTLSMISMTAGKTGGTVILKVCDNLICFYKGILSRGKLTTSIQDEINMIDRYVEIMRFVYGIDIDLIYEMEEGIPALYTLKLILQPLVENAIVHGLRPAGGGVVMISGERKDGLLRFEIADSGVGMPDEMKKCLSASMYRGERGPGYGLSNVAKRIRLFFGEAYGLGIDSEEGHGTKVVLTVPALTQEEIGILFSKGFNI